jgi:hypothetical protein
MKTRTLLFLLPALCLGCLQTPKTAAKPPAPTTTAQTPRAPGVRADQVNERNARASADALQAELDRASQDVYDKPQPQVQVTQAKGS